MFGASILCLSNHVGRWLAPAKVTLQDLPQGGPGRGGRCQAPMRGPGIDVLPHPREHVTHPLLHTTVSTVPMQWHVGSEQEASRREGLGTDVVENAGQNNRELGSEEMFLEGDKAPRASSGNCFV